MSNFATDIIVAWKNPNRTSKNTPKHKLRAPGHRPNWFCFSYDTLKFESLTSGTTKFPPWLNTSKTKQRLFDFAFAWHAYAEVHMDTTFSSVFV